MHSNSFQYDVQLNWMCVVCWWDGEYFFILLFYLFIERPLGKASIVESDETPMKGEITSSEESNSQPPTSGGSVMPPEPS